MNEITLMRTNSENEEFRKLVALLDEDLRIKDGDEHAFFAQYNKIDKIKHVLVAYKNNVAIGCGAIKQYSEKVAEIKRMFVVPEHRGSGIAGKILAELERWAGELAFEECILETGKKQVEAVRLYRKCNYTLIPNYGQYQGVESSVCMSKKIQRI